MSVLWFDGLLTQRNDAGVYFMPENDSDELREAASVNRFRCVGIGLRACQEKNQLLAAFAHALHFPAHFGHNWDALLDALCEERTHDTKGLVLLLEDSDLLRRDAVDDFKMAMEVLQAASREWAERGALLWTFIALTEDEFASLG